jgi:hypothetical protein
VTSATFTVMQDGVPVAIDPATAVNVQLFSLSTMTPISQARAVASNEGDADWSAGVVGVVLLTSEQQALTPPAVMVVISSNSFVKRFKLEVKSPSKIDKSLLFIKDFIVDELRADRLMVLAQTFFPGITFSDDFLWEKVISSENETAFDLRVPLVPTQFFGTDPTPAQVAALPRGMPFDVDPAQDYEPDFFQGEKWGFMVLRNKPVIDVQRVTFVYPAPTTGFFDFPQDWLRIDKKYGQIRFVPASSTFVAPLNAFLLQALGGGRTIPFAFEVMYTAGITNVRQQYPQLVDVIKRRAVMKVIEDGFIPSSGSISADGLSQSLSVDLEKYRDTINTTLFGPKGVNGGLLTAIHGIKVSMLGM